MNNGDVAWILVSSALVLLMTPGLRAVLWRTRAKQERGEYHYVQLHEHGDWSEWSGCSGDIRSRSVLI